MGYELGNIDATVAAERPKLNPHIPLMKKTLADMERKLQEKQQ